jgi:cytidine deaminase
MEEKLRNLLNNAYTPYFKYPVAAIIIMKDGKEFTGVNVETSSPSAGICAERNALYSAIAEGYSKKMVKEIHIMSKTEEDCFPCFICRQALNDLCDRDTMVISHTYSGKTSSHTIEELCPYPFGDDNLE